MLRPVLLTLAAASLVAAAALDAGCGSDVRDHSSSSSDGGDGGVGFPSSASSTGPGGAGPGSTGSGAHPPPPGPSHPGDGAGVVLAFSKLFLGDTDRQGAKSASAWKQFGFDIDGKISTEASTDLCAPAQGGKKSSVYPDGDSGIDNSFGKNLLPILSGVSADYSTQVNESISGGHFTILLDIAQLGAATDYNPLSTRAYRGGELGLAPKFDGSDAWPVRADSLLNPGDLASAKLQMPSSYVTGNTWVSGPSDAVLQLPLGSNGLDMTFTIHHVLLAMDLAPDHQSATNGTISGVLDTEEFIAELKKFAGAFSPDLCSESTIESIANQMRQTSDIMIDGTAGNPAQPCNAISIGLGFDARQMQLGGFQSAPPPAPDPCAPSPGG